MYKRRIGLLLGVLLTLSMGFTVRAAEIEGDITDKETEAFTLEAAVTENQTGEELLGGERPKCTYTDSRGNEIIIVGGVDSCAQKVIEFKKGSPWTTAETNMNQDSILGAPDYEENGDDPNNGGALTLGRDGSITLEFAVDIVDGDGNDIYVFEVGPKVEATTVEVSNDLENWINVGKASGSLSGVDMKGKIPEGSKYKYVRITDAKSVWGTAYPGADVDAVGIINSEVRSELPPDNPPAPLPPDNPPDNPPAPLPPDNPPDNPPDALPFKDVSPKNYFYKPVEWAYKNGVTNGKTADTFDPYSECTRGEAITFIWNVKGQPKANISSVTFEDIDTKAFYFKAMLWGVENDVISGFDAKHFGPEQRLTRGQFVTMLHGLEGRKKSSISNPFVDVPSKKYYYKPVLWAVENKVTSGVDATHFGPDVNCQRAHVVTFLYNTYAK